MTLQHHHRKHFTVGTVFFKFVLYIYAVVNLYPIIWMLFYSFKDNMEIFTTNPFGPRRRCALRTTSRPGRPSICLSTS